MTCAALIATTMFRSSSNKLVMAGFVPAIHVFILGQKDVDARAERGHDGRRC